MPSCPLHYKCTFVPQERYVLTRVHEIGPWWHGPAGIVLAALAIVVSGAVLAFIVHQIAKAKEEVRDARERQLKRQSKLAIEEQRTIQADAAKGDPEMLKLIRQGSLV